MVNACAPAASTSSASRTRPVSGTALRLLRLLALLTQGTPLHLADALESDLTRSAGQLVKDLHALRQLGLPLSRPIQLNLQGYTLRHSLPAHQWQPLHLHCLTAIHEHIRRDGSPALQAALSTVLPWFCWRTDPSQHALLPASVDGDRVGTAANDTESIAASGTNVSLPLGEWDRLCRERQQLQMDIVPTSPGTPSASRVIIEPHRLLTEGIAPALLGYSPSQCASVLIPLLTVERVVQLPTINRQDVALQRVVFRLSGRLARTCRLYGGEQILGGSLGVDDHLSVEAWVAHVDGLLDRLMRYGPHCDVLQPATARRRMRARIAEQLSLLHCLDES